MAKLSANEVIAHGLALPFSERMSVANELLASVEPPGILSTSDPSFIKEIERRSDELHSGKTTYIDGETSLREAREMVERYIAEKKAALSKK